MNLRTAAIAATAAFALGALGAAPAFADNHSAVAPQAQDGNFEHLDPIRQFVIDGQSEHLAPQAQGPQYLQFGTNGDQGPTFLWFGTYGEQGAQFGQDGAPEHLATA
ncbi:hypothetical protein ACWGDE_28620 [Streptomyces sp. NPDC054956]